MSQLTVHKQRSVLKGNGFNRKTRKELFSLNFIRIMNVMWPTDRHNTMGP